MSTEKTIIYPPIFVMESHADRILSSRASEKGRNCLGSACSSTTAKGFRGRYHLRNKKEQHSAARIGKSRQICAISGCLRLCTATYPVRNAGLTLLQKESRYSPSAEEIFPLSVRSEQDFAPTGKPQRNPQTTEKKHFQKCQERFQNWRKGMVDQGNALCADHKTGYKKKRKEHRKHLPIPEQQSVCGTCGNGFRGKKHQKEKSDQKKHRQFFCFHRVYLPYSFAIVYEKTQTDIPGHMCIEEIQCE